MKWRPGSPVRRDREIRVVGPAPPTPPRAAADGDSRAGGRCESAAVRPYGNVRKPKPDGPSAGGTARLIPRR